MAERPVFEGLLDLGLVLLSVLLHELGHLSAAVARGAADGSIHIMLVEWRPVFVTYHGDDDDRVSCSLLSPLAGVIFQWACASGFGVIAASTNNGSLLLAMLLVDVAALAALIPTPGSDGFWFLSALMKSPDMSRDYWSRLRNAPTHRGVAGAPAPAIVALLALSYYALYVTLSTLLLVGVLHKSPVHALGPSVANKADLAGTILLMVVPVYLAAVGWLRLRFVIRFVRQFVHVVLSR